MKQETSQWGKAVKKAVIDHDMTLKQLAEKIGRRINLRILRASIQENP